MGKLKTKSVLSCAVLVAMISGVQTGYAMPVPPVYGGAIAAKQEGKLG